MQKQPQPWLYSAMADSIFVLAPAFLVTLAVFLFPGSWQAQDRVAPWQWLVLVVGVDVAHVYSTLYRTYFDPEASRQFRTVLIAIPVGCWIGGALLYAQGGWLFWRVLAYIAVFHFVRQQYGFLRLYSRREQQPRWARWLDAAAIYAASVYPMVYWHTHDRAFHWFVKGDFFTVSRPGLERAAWVVYLLIQGAYVTKEIARAWRERTVNGPKNLIWLGTAASWYVGIVAFNGDLTFTLTNVVAHGVPYMALVWFYQRKQAAKPASEEQRGYLERWFRPAMIPAFVGLLVALAYVEEGLWDALVWRDHSQYFPWLAGLPQITEADFLAMLVPLLALPQATHYVLDGFIWKLRDLKPVQS
jgi:hypothetical protein